MHADSDDFLLFAGEEYYPCGGWWDFQGAFGSLEAAKHAAAGKNERGEPPDWWHIINARTNKCVACDGSSLYGKGTPATPPTDRERIEQIQQFLRHQNLYGWQDPKLGLITLETRIP